MFYELKNKKIKKYFPNSTQMHESIKSIKTEELIKCQNSFIIL